jgi:hypothetical protein
MIGGFVVFRENLFRRWKHFRSSPIQPQSFITKLGSENNLMDTRLIWLKFALTFSPWVAPAKGDRDREIKIK